jgi:hypothetical protein
VLSSGSRVPMSWFLGPLNADLGTVPVLCVRLSNEASEASVRSLEL